MRHIIPLILILVSLVLINTSYGEVLQLQSVTTTIDADKVKHYTAEELLQKEEGKIFVINFLSLSFEKKYAMTTKSYKSHFKNINFFKKTFDKETYDKIDFRKIDLFHDGKDGSMTIKTNVYWFLEGYSGVSTMYFMLKKIDNKWLLDWLVF